MRSLIVFPLLLVSSLRTVAAAGTPGGQGPAPLPAFSHESNKFQLHIDKQSVEFVNQKLGGRPPKVRKRRWDDKGVARRADVIDRDVVDMLTDRFRQLVAENALVPRLAQEVAAIPDAFNPGWNQLENLPRFEDVNVQQAFIEVIPVAVVYIPQRAPALRRPIFEFSAITIMILGMINAFRIGQLLGSSISLNTQGVMENSCPNPKQNTCGQPFCKGAGNQCNGNSFLKNCQCESSDCPASDQLQLFCTEKDCGGQDVATGTCVGRAGDGKNKGCYCGGSKVFKYPFKQSSFDALKDLVKLGDWKPPAPQPPKDEPIIDDGSDDGKCENSKTVGDRGIMSKPIDKNKLQRCLKSLPIEKNEWFGNLDCEGLVQFQSGTSQVLGFNTWENVGHCYNACKKCLSHSIADGVNQIYCDVQTKSAHCWIGYTIPDPPLIDEGDPYSEDQLRIDEKDGWFDKYAAQQCLKRLSWTKWFNNSDPPACDVGNGRWVKFTKQGSGWNDADHCHNALIRCVSVGINNGGTNFWCDKYEGLFGSAHCWFGMETFK